MRRRDAKAGEAPAWIRKLDDLTARGAAGLAALFVLVKPKNLLLTIGAGVSVAQVGAGPAGQAAALAVFVALGSTGIWGPLLLHLLAPERGRPALVRARDWMIRENATILAVLALLIAAKLLGDAISTLAG